jgi:hypothetical protein
MRFIDDILMLIGFLFVVAAAFGIDWRLGCLVFGCGCMTAGWLAGRYIVGHMPEVLEAERARAEKRRRKKQKRGEEA